MARKPQMLVIPRSDGKFLHVWRKWEGDTVGLLIIGETLKDGARLYGPGMAAIPVSRDEAMQISVWYESFNQISPSKRRATYLLELLYGPKSASVCIGDIEQRYHMIRDTYGDHKAELYFWTQIAREIFSIAAHALKRLPVIGGIIWLCRWIMRQIGL